MENNQPKNQKLLTPLMLVTALSMVAAPVMAYDHNKQISVSIGSDGVEIGDKVIGFTYTGSGASCCPHDKDSD